MTGCSSFGLDSDKEELDAGKKLHVRNSLDSYKVDPFNAVQELDSCIRSVLLGKKYGGIAPKKPLISKDSGRAFFDSADWALGKQGVGTSQKTRTAMECLRPKLQPTPHQQLPPRRPTCTSGKDNLD